MLFEVSKGTEIGVPPAAVWALISDVPRLTGCLPNVVDLREVEPDRRYAATVSDRLGPFRLSVPVEIELRTVEAPRRIVAGLTGADSRGLARVRGELEAVVEPGSAGGARLTLGMRLEVLGKLATLGALPMRRRADELFNDFVRRVDDALAAVDGRPNPPGPTR